MLARKPVLFTAVSLVTSLYFATISLAGPPLVIENSPGKIRDGEIKAELRGARIVTASPKFLESTSFGVTVPKNVVVEAVKGSPGLQQALNLLPESGELTFPKIADAAQFAQGKNIKWKPSERAISGVYCGIPKGKTNTAISWEHLSCDSNTKYNSEAVAQLLLNGGLDTNNIISHEVDGHNVDLVAVRPNYASVMIAGNQAAYRLLGEKGVSTIHPDTTALRDTITHATDNDNVLNAAFLRKDNVTFGMPLVENSVDAQLLLPKQVSNKFDVYLLQLAMTWRELPRDDLDELGFSVKVPAGTIALALMPFRYGVEVTEKTETNVSPEVEAEGAKVSLGEVYGREISFSYLRPTIRAYGLQESQFSWTMRDQAVQPGAEQFVCVVGVPKQSKELTLKVSAFAQWSGGWVTAAGVESTEEKVMQVSLQ